jgi:hypothetical protein
MANIKKFNEYNDINIYDTHYSMNEKRIISSHEIQNAVKQIISFDNFDTDIRFELENAITKAVAPILKKNGILLDVDRSPSLKRPQAELVNFSQDDVTLKFVVPVAVETGIEIISKKQKKTVLRDVIKPNSKSYEIDLTDLKDKDNYQITLKSEKGNSILDFYLDKVTLPESDEVYKMHPAIG